MRAGAVVACCIVLVLHTAVAVVWNEASHGDAPPADCTAAQNSYSTAQSMLGADPLTGITGSTTGQDAADTFTFHAVADGVLTISMTQFSTFENAVQPALFLFSVSGTLATPIYTPLVGSRRFPNSGSALPSVSISNANGRYMIAVTRNAVVPRNAAGQNFWPINIGLNNAAPLVSGNLQGWSATNNPSSAAQTYTLSITYTSTAPGFVFGDPHFKGYKGQSFDFQGLPGRAYQLYSDDTVALNVQMIPWTGPANKVAPNSTVVGHARLFFGMHYIDVDTMSFNRSTGTLLLKTNNGEHTLRSSHTLTTELFECANIMWQAPKLTVLHEKYEMRISWSFRSYNNGTFINVELDVPDSVLAGNRPRGGLLGQTLIDGPPSLDSRDFGVSTLGSTDAKTNLFHPRPNTCNQ